MHREFFFFFFYGPPRTGKKGARGKKKRRSKKVSEYYTVLWFPNKEHAISFKSRAEKTFSISYNASVT